MSWLAWSLVASCAIALQATLLALVNLRRYRRTVASESTGVAPTSVSVCVPARNEEANIEACVRSLLASDTANGSLSIEVLCYDDESTDQTPAILARLRSDDPRVRVVRSAPLPEGWNGKQHACWRMAREASGAWMLFTDADVRFEPDALRRAIAFARRSGAALVSTVPQQVVGSLGEALIVPLIHVLLLSYLPIGRMRSTRDPAASAGCGQFLLVDRDAYQATGGHERFRASMHDGIRMPRLLREAGYATDLFDGTDLVSVRMYRGFRATWRGFAKNAFEGLGSVALLVLLTLLHGVGHVWPFVALAWLAATGSIGSVEAAIAAAAVLIAWTGRAALARRFRQPLWIVFAHPISLLLMTGIQWHSYSLALRGRREWKGRRAAPAGASVST